MVEGGIITHPSQEGLSKLWWGENHNAPREKTILMVGDENVPWKIYF